MGYDVSISVWVKGEESARKEFERFMKNQEVPERLAAEVPEDYFETEDFSTAFDLVYEPRLGPNDSSSIQELSEWFPELEFHVSEDQFENGLTKDVWKAGEVIESEFEEWEGEEDEEDEEYEEEDEEAEE